MPFDKKQARDFYAFMLGVSRGTIRVLKPGGFFLFFCMPRLSYAGAWAADEAGFEIRDIPVWEHDGGQGKSCSHAYWVMRSRERTPKQKRELVDSMAGLGTPQLRPVQELFVMAQKPCGGVAWKNFERHGTGYIRTKFDGRQQTNIFRYSKPKARNMFDHMTLKPVSLMERIIEIFSLKGQTVLDMCMGSGTTGEAALRTGRKFIGMEIDPHSFAVAQDRIHGVVDMGRKL